MPPTTIRTCPTPADFTSLAEYQSQTPESFFDGKPVLHRHVQSAKAWVSKDHAASLPIFVGAPSPPAASAPPGAQLSDGAVPDDVVEQTVDVFVNSENFTLFNSATNAGVAIPYPSISIHAVKQIGTITTGDSGAQLQAVWMQLDIAAPGSDDSDEGTSVDLTIVPPVASVADADATATATANNNGTASTTPQNIQALYDAISACSDLHPDPNPEGGDEDDDEDAYYNDRIVFEGEAVQGFDSVYRGEANGGLPPPFPGSSGWITAENVHEYFDAEGNWIGDDGDEAGAEGREPLGEGAGRVRARGEGEEANGHGDGHGDGDGGEGGADDPESKRARVDDGPAAP